MSESGRIYAVSEANSPDPFYAQVGKRDVFDIVESDICGHMGRIPVVIVKYDGGRAGETVQIATDRCIIWRKQAEAPND